GCVVLVIADRGRSTRIEAPGHGAAVSTRSIVVPEPVAGRSVIQCDRQEHAISHSLRDGVIRRADADDGHFSTPAVLCVTAPPGLVLPWKAIGHYGGGDAVQPRKRVGVGAAGTPCQRRETIDAEVIGPRG